MAPSSTWARKPATNGTVSCRSTAVSNPCPATSQVITTVVANHHITPAATEKPA